MPRELTEEDFQKDKDDIEDTPQLEPVDEGPEEAGSEDEYLEGGPGTDISFDEKGNVIEPGKEEETTTKEEEEVKKPEPRFKSHDEAEDGYRNAQSELAKAKQANETLQTVLSQLGAAGGKVPVKTDTPPQDPYMPLSRALLKDMNSIPEDDPEANEKATAIWLRHLDNLSGSRIEQSRGHEDRMKQFRETTEKRAINEGGIHKDDMDIFWAAVQLTPAGLTNDQTFEAACKLYVDLSGRFQGRFSKNEKTLKKHQRETSSLTRSGGTKSVTQTTEEDEDNKPQTLISQIEKSRRRIAK